MVCRICGHQGTPTCSNAPRGGRRRRHRVLLRGQRRRPALRDAGRGRRLCRDEARRHFCGPHHRIGRGGARAVRCCPSPGPAVCGCPRVGRPGGRTERHAHGDVRRRCGRLRGRSARGHGVLARLHAAGRQRLGPVGQDGQPDLHRRAGAGPVGSRGVWPERRAGHEAGAGRDRQGRGPELADGQPWQDHGGRPIRLRLCGGLDAQGPGPGAG